MKTDNEILEDFKASAKRLIEWRANHPKADMLVNGEGSEKHPDYISALKNTLLMHEVNDRFFLTDYHFHIERLAFIPVELYEAIRRKDEAFITENFPNLYQQQFDEGEDDAL